MNICKEQLRFNFGEWIDCQHSVKIQVPNTNQTDALEHRSRDESNTLVTKPFRVNRTRPFQVFESQTRNYYKVSTSLSHPISYRITKTNNNRTNRIIKAYKQPNGDADNTKHIQRAKQQRSSTTMSNKPKTAIANMNHQHRETRLRSGSKIHLHQDATDHQTTEPYESPSKAATRT